MASSIFVFGSNLAGHHGAGAALWARQHCGAVQGVGEGLTGRAYALPTKDQYIRPRSFKEVAASVATFLEFARHNGQMLFKVTRVGCGLAGFTDDQIAPLFLTATANCGFDPAWARFGLKTWAELEI